MFPKVKLWKFSTSHVDYNDRFAQILAENVFNWHARSTSGWICNKWNGNLGTLMRYDKNSCYPHFKWGLTIECLSIRLCSMTQCAFNELQPKTHNCTFIYNVYMTYILRTASIKCMYIKIIFLYRGRGLTVSISLV